MAPSLACKEQIRNAGSTYYQKYAESLVILWYKLTSYDQKQRCHQQVKQRVTG